MTRADIVIDRADMDLDPASRAWVDSEDCDPTNRRNVEIFTEFSSRAPEGKEQRIVLRFCCSPVEITGDGRVEGIVVGHNDLTGEGGRIRASDTGERETIECGLVLRSIGYRGEPLDDGMPFDPDRGLVPNEAGRVSDESGAQVPGLYAVGWIKRGPSGVIGTNKKDASETVASLLADLESGAIARAGGPRRGRRDRGAGRRASPRPRQLRGLEGDRRRRGRRRRAARPPACQVLLDRGDGRGGENHRLGLTAS